MPSTTHDDKVLIEKENDQEKVPAKKKDDDSK